MNDPFFLLILTVVIVLAILVLVIITLLLYVFWPRPMPKSGKVIAKWHEDELLWTQFYQIGQTGIYAPTFNFINEGWVITIEDETDLRGNVYLTKLTWDKTQIGDYFTVQK